MDQTAHNLQQQIEMYGETLGEVVRRVTGPLSLTQGGLAQVIGLSAPMLSQLMSAQRVKIGNPAVVSRLRAVSDLADLAIANEIAEHEIPHELDRIRAATGAYTHPTTAQMPRAAARSSGQLGQPGQSGQSGQPGQPGQPAVPTVTFATPAELSAGLPAGQAWPSAVRHEVPVTTPPSARTVVREIQDLFREVASADEIQRAAAAAAAESPAIADLLLAYGTGRTADALAHYEEHHG
jgi:hypothetical protein